MVLTEDVQGSVPGSAPQRANPAVSCATDAHAKINLTLGILRPRGDGYHDLDSLVIGVSLADQVRLRVRGGPGVDLRCSVSALEGADNLAARAAALFCRITAVRQGVSIELTKRVPVGAGLGGGSSDAAATLRLCNHLFSTGLERSRLAELGAELGSDVPFFFHLPAARIAGRGECVEPVSLEWSGWVLLAFVPVSVSTAATYDAWRPADSRQSPGDVVNAILRAGRATELSELLYNDLEPAVMRVAPQVAGAFHEARRMHLGPVRISGAGSTFFWLFDERDEADAAARKVQAAALGLHTEVVAAPVKASAIV